MNITFERTALPGQLTLSLISRRDQQVVFKTQTSLREIAELHLSLHSDAELLFGGEADLTEITEDRLQRAEIFFSQLIGPCESAPWQLLCLLQFFGRASVSAEMTQLNTKISKLEADNATLSSNLQKISSALIGIQNYLFPSGELTIPISATAVSASDLSDGSSAALLGSQPNRTTPPLFSENSVEWKSEQVLFTGGKLDVSSPTNATAGAGLAATSLGSNSDVASGVVGAIDDEASFNACSKLEREADELVRFLQPREVQFRFRSAAAEMLRGQIQKALHCNAFDVSFFELKCFLPDDSIKLTVVLNESSSLTWHKILYDRLVILSEHHEIRQESHLSQLGLQHSLTEDDCPFRVSEVRLISDSSTFRVVGMIDELQFEIVSNGRIDLCLLAFFEEVGNLVGNDHLLKRSVLLIRSWWWYETPVQGEKSAREYLPDFGIWLTIISIFNIHHARITSPIHALYFFLLTYATYDGSNQAVTLLGLKSFAEGTNTITMNHSDDSHLIPAKLLEKYYHVINVNSNATDFSQPQTVKVDRGYNVLNPFTLENMTLEKLSTRKIQRIQAFFQASVLLFKRALRDVCSPTLARKSRMLGELYEQTTRLVFSVSGARKDSFKQEVLTQGQMELELLRSPRDVFNVEVGQLWHDILYCNFVLKAVVSESALLSLCTEVLTERKILPVGEVGKIVSDVTVIPHLSSQLREKFGGLKKFLERYPEIFVFSKDHPFNPNVVLKKSITAEQFDMVERGVITLQSLFKGGVNVKQQQQQQQGQSGSGSGQGSGNKKKDKAQLTPPAPSISHIAISSAGYGADDQHRSQGKSSMPFNMPPVALDSLSVSSSASGGGGSGRGGGSIGSADFSWKPFDDKTYSAAQDWGLPLRGTASDAAMGGVSGRGFPAGGSGDRRKGSVSGGMYPDSPPQKHPPPEWFGFDTSSPAASGATNNWLSQTGASSLSTADYRLGDAGPRGSGPPFLAERHPSWLSQQSASLRDEGFPPGLVISGAGSGGGTGFDGSHFGGIGSQSYGFQQPGPTQHQHQQQQQQQQYRSQQQAAGNPYGMPHSLGYPQSSANSRSTAGISGGMLGGSGGMGGGGSSGGGAGRTNSTGNFGL